VLEKVINVNDFLEIRYLDAGTRAARAVGRITIRDERERNRGYGTGSLVSPRLLLTNHHVLPDAATAKYSVVEFNYQDDVDRKPLRSVQFGFDPDSFFVADKPRDFALVAIAATAEELAEFGFNPLIPAEGKAIVGEYVTIVQHPNGEKKQLVLRDQQIIDVPEESCTTWPTPSPARRAHRCSTTNGRSSRCTRRPQAAPRETSSTGACGSAGSCGRSTTARRPPRRRSSSRGSWSVRRRRSRRTTADAGDARDDPSPGHAGEPRGAPSDGRRMGGVHGADRDSHAARRSGGVGRAADAAAAGRSVVGRALAA
jgi:hypothetical protein